MALLTTCALGAALVALTVLIHHEALRLALALLPRAGRASRWQGCIIVLCAMAGHVVEVELWAAGFWLSIDVLELGYIAGELASPSAYAYFSFSCYTSLGVGDLVPHGQMRLLAGIEALNGLVLIGWTASFLLVELRERGRTDAGVASAPGRPVDPLGR